MLSFEKYNMLNESVRSELFKNGMCVSYSKDGQNTNYNIYLCLTDKDDIKKALSDLKWPSLFEDSDRYDILNDKYGILIASKEKGAEYVLISDILVNNILYIWDTDLKLSDCIKDEYIIDLKKKCNSDNLIYEKDVDFSKIVTLLPDEPYFNYGFQPTDWSSLSRGYDAWALDHSPNMPGSFKQPNPLYT